MTRVALSLACFIACVSPSLAASPVAEILCRPTAQLVDQLSTRMRSQKQAVGLRAPDQTLELWTASDGDWTLVVTYAGGTSCIVAMGESWTALQPANEIKQPS